MEDDTELNERLYSTQSLTRIVYLIRQLWAARLEHLISLSQKLSQICKYMSLLCHAGLLQLKRNKTLIKYIPKIVTIDKLFD